MEEMKKISDQFRTCFWQDIKQNFHYVLARLYGAEIKWVQVVLKFLCAFTNYISVFLPDPFVLALNHTIAHLIGGETVSTQLFTHKFK